MEDVDLNKKFYTAVAYFDPNTGRLKLATVLDGWNNEIYKEGMVLPFVAEDNEDALKVADEIIDKSNARVLAELQRRQNQ